MPEAGSINITDRRDVHWPDLSRLFLPDAPTPL
jgi:hypothetical protein